MEFIEAINVLNKQAYLYFLCGELELSEGLFIFIKSLLALANKN